MNNIYKYEKKYKKNRNIKVIKFFKKETTLDILHLNIYATILNRKIDGYSKMEFLKKKSELYDTELFVQVIEFENYIKLIYTCDFLKEEFIQNDITKEALELFEKFMETKEIDHEEFEIAKNDYKIYLNRFLENKQNIANEMLFNGIRTDALYLNLEDYMEQLNKITVEQVKNVIGKLKELPGYVNIVNLEKEINKNYIQTTEIPKVEKIQYAKAENKQRNLNLDQCYVSCAVKINNATKSEAQIINLILGGDVYSRLFKIIREQMHLSYSIHSRVISDSLILIEGGVNLESKEIINDEITKLIQNLAKEEFKNEFDLAKASYTSSLLKNKDNVVLLNNISQENYLHQKTTTLDDKIKEIEKIKYEQIEKLFKSCEILTTVLVY